MAIRSNPFYQSICNIRVGMYRQEACYNCRKLSECDQHWDESKQKWDYPLKRFEGRAIRPEKSQKEKIIKVYPKVKRHAGRYLDLINSLMTIKTKEFSAKEISKYVNDTPRSTANYLKNLSGINYNRHTRKYYLNGDKIDIINGG